MRKVRATRFNHPSEHAQYGIYNWFKLNGVSDTEVMKAAMYVFCEVEGFDMSKFNKETTRCNWINNRFQKFAKVALKYLRENNYILEKYPKLNYNL